MTHCRGCRPPRKAVHDNNSIPASTITMPLHFPLQRWRHPNSSKSIYPHRHCDEPSHPLRVHPSPVVPGTAEAVLRHPTRLTTSKDPPHAAPQPDTSSPLTPEGPSHCQRLGHGAQLPRHGSVQPGATPAVTSARHSQRVWQDGAPITLQGTTPLPTLLHGCTRHTLLLGTPCLA